MTTEIWAGDMIEMGDLKIVPFSRVHRLRAPFRNFSLVWNRPTSVLVTDAEGNERIHRIVDVTRRAQILILAWGALAALMILVFYRKR